MKIGFEIKKKRKPSPPPRFWPKGLFLFPRPLSVFPLLARFLSPPTRPRPSHDAGDSPPLFLFWAGAHSPPRILSATSAQRADAAQASRADTRFPSPLHSFPDAWTPHPESLTVGARSSVAPPFLLPLSQLPNPDLLGIYLPWSQTVHPVRTTTLPQCLFSHLGAPGKP